MTEAIVSAGSPCAQGSRVDHPRSDRTHRLSRRRGLYALSAAALAAIGADPAQAIEPVDPHLAWAAEAARIKAEIQAMFDRDEVEDDDHHDRLAAPYDELDQLIVDTPARTVMGVAVQLRFVMGCKCPGGHDYMEDRALRNALATVEMLAGSAAHG